jgi:hypothetical protein
MNLEYLTGQMTEHVLPKWPAPDFMEQTEVFFKRQVIVVVNKQHAIYGTMLFITVVTTARHWSLSTA